MTTKERLAPKIKSQKYLKHPVRGQYQISEGYIYNKNERDLHHNYYHKGIDYSQKFGSPVYAAASGYAVASYHRFPVLNKDYTFSLYKGKPIGNGLGYFIQIFHQEKVCGIKGGRVTQYGHLSSVADIINIKQTKPLEFNHAERLNKVNEAKKKNRKNTKEMQSIINETQEIVRKYPWTKTYYGYNFSENLNEKESYLYTPSEIVGLHNAGNRYVTYVEQGQIIGFIGNSALIFGQPTYEESYEFQTKESETWDETHLHFEEATRSVEKGNKRLQRDPYGIYMSSKHYIQPFPKSALFLDI